MLSNGKALDEIEKQRKKVAEGKAQKFLIAIDEAGYHIRQNDYAIEDWASGTVTYHAKPIWSGKTLAEAVQLAVLRNWRAQ